MSRGVCQSRCRRLHRGVSRLFDVTATCLFSMTGLGKDRDRQVINLNAELKSQTNGIRKVAGATPVVTEAARKTVSQDAFARMTIEFSKLTNVMGSIASLIVRDHVRTLG